MYFISLFFVARLVQPNVAEPVETQVRHRHDRVNAHPGVSQSQWQNCRYDVKI